jgi:APA family basic amino acid/polyamine antiporter
VEKQQQRTLKRSIGLWSAVAINIGAIIGGGIFVVIGIVAGYAGSAMIISMVIAGIIAYLTASSFVKLTAWQPVEGSVYEYGRQLVSPYFGFLTGWMWIVSNTFTGAAVSLGFAYYLTSVFPGLPSNIVAAILCLSFTALNLIGAKESATVNNILVAIKILVLFFFIVLGFFHINTGNFSVFEPLSNGVLFGAYFIFFAYGGFARVAVVAEEVKDAKKNVPRAMLLSLGISMAIYIFVGVISVGLLGSAGLSNSSSPLTTAINATGYPLAVQIVAVGGLVATASVLLTSILGVSRIAYSMARRNDLPAIFSKLHYKFLTPYYAILLSGVLMASLVLFVDLTRVVAISTFALLFYYSVTNFAAFKMKNASHKSKTLSIAGLASCILLLIFVLFASIDSWIVGTVFLLVGTFLYYLRKKLKHNVKE